MKYEVEQKFPADHQALAKPLESLGVRWGAQREERDT
jgi:hypothetical protein